MIECGDFLDEPEKDPENGMIFKLDPGLNPDLKEKKNEDPMWSAASSAQMDWFFADE